MRRAGQSPYLSTATAHQSTSSVSLQDYARSALSLPESQPVASTSAAASSSNPQGAAPKKKKKKRKKPRSEVDPDIQSAVANVGLPLGRSERSNRGEQPRTRESGASTAGQSQSGPQVQDTGRDLVQFRQRHDVWADIEAIEEPPPAFIHQTASQPTQEQPEPNSPPPSYLDLTDGPASSDDWPPLFLLPAWLNVEALPVWEESRTDVDSLRAWRTDELSGLPIEERARRFHLRKRRRDRLEKTKSQIQREARQRDAPVPQPAPVRATESDFLQATNELIRNHRTSVLASSSQEPNANSDSSARANSTSSSDSESEANEPMPVVSRPLGASVPISHPRLPAVTFWENLSSVQEEAEDVLPTPDAVTVWSKAQAKSPVSQRYETLSPPPRSSSSTVDSSEPEDRREVGRRHSLLLGRPLSVKRKPPPVPAPRRWAKAVERASSASEDEHCEAWAQRPTSATFSPRMEALRAKYERKTPPPVPPKRSSRVESRPPALSTEDADAQRARSRQNTLERLIGSPIGPRPPPENASHDVSASFRGQFERVSLSDAPMPQLQSVPLSPIASMQAEESVAGIAEEGNVEMQSEPESNRREEESTQHQTAYPPSSTPSQGSTAMQQTSSGLHDRAPSPLQSGPTQRQASVHYTELDALASRINDERVSTGEAYDDILLLSEVLGPHQSGGASHKAREAELWDQIPVLPVEETRRRTDPKTGKTRIKLSCGGVSVNKCQVCLAQFKAGDMGAIFPGCTHCFHENCLRSWLRQGTKAYCPNCRRDI